VFVWDDSCFREKGKSRKETKVRCQPQYVVTGANLGNEIAILGGGVGGITDVNTGKNAHGKTSQAPVGLTL